MVWQGSPGDNPPGPYANYYPSWIAAAEARPLSLSLPINLDGIPLKGEKVGYFF